MEQQQRGAVLLDAVAEDVHSDLLNLAEERLADLTSGEPSAMLDAVVRRLLAPGDHKEKPPVSAFGSSL